MLLTIMAPLAQVEHETSANVSRIPSANAKKPDSTLAANRRVADGPIRSVVRLIESGEPFAQVAYNFGTSRATLHGRSRALTKQQSSI
jgi:DNA invertase Pin-like site-specific DNA recombinase